jgi:hypothetical protein
MTGKKLKMNKAILLLCCLCVGLTASAQKTFKYAAKVRRIDTTGFYSIMLQPALVAKSKANLADLRLMDDSGRFVPYTLAFGQPTWLDNSVPYISFPVVKTSSASDTGTTFVVKNTCPVPVDNLQIKLKNAAVERTLNIYGSDDLAHWFVIKENMPIQPVGTANGSDYDQELSFPPSNYHYLKLMVNDKHRGHIKFLAAGTYQRQPLPTRYMEISGVKFTKHDTANLTRITLTLDGNYWINKITLGIKAPKFYNRNVSVYQLNGRERELLNTEALRSGDEGSLQVDVKTNKLLLEIDNEDNRPLDIYKFGLFQTERSALAYLEAGRSYTFLTGDTAAAAPRYDLRFFTDSAKNRARNITHDAVINNPLYAAVVPVHTKANDRGIVIWAAIVMALLLLSLLTWKMAGEVKKRG